MTNKPATSSKLISFLIALLGGLWAFGVNSYNAQYLESSGSHQIKNGMVITADDASYLVPPENFSKTGIWKDNTQGISSYMNRPPGMGILHFVFYQLSPSHFHLLHKLFNLLLHVCSLYFFGLACHLLIKRWAVVVQCLLAILPCFWGYLFYYLSESITPALLILLFYGYVIQWKQKSKYGFILQSILAGCLILVRPQLIIFLLPYFYFLVSRPGLVHSKKLITIIFGCLLAFGGYAVWQIRCYKIADGWTGIHPIYSATNNTQYRPVHKSFGELFKIWEHNSERFHNTMTAFWVADLNNDQVPVSDNKISWPNDQVPVSHQPMLRDLLQEYYLINLEIKPYVDQNKPVPGETSGEVKLRHTIDSLTAKWKRTMWKENYFTTPIYSIKFMFTKSQLNLHMFQYKFRSCWWMETLRWCCVILIIFTTILSLTDVFNYSNKLLWLTSLSVFVYLFYLFFIQKMNEERYLVPLLPIFLLMGAERLKFYMGKIISYRPR